jgi:hypothetical protein
VDKKERIWFRRGGMELIDEGRDRFGRRVFRVIHALNIVPKRSPAIA